MIFDGSTFHDFDPHLLSDRGLLVLPTISKTLAGIISRIAFLSRLVESTVKGVKCSTQQNFVAQVASLAYQSTE